MKSKKVVHTAEDTTSTVDKDTRTAVDESLAVENDVRIMLTLLHDKHNFVNISVNEFINYEETQNVHSCDMLSDDEILSIVRNEGKYNR